MIHHDISRHKLLSAYRRADHKLRNTTPNNAVKFLRRMCRIEKRLHVYDPVKWGLCTMALCIAALTFKPTEAYTQTFAPPVVDPFGLPLLDPAWTWEEYFDLADLDGDGDVDLFMTTGDGFKYYENATEDGDAVFILNDTADMGYAISMPNFVDIDADGDLDNFSGWSDAFSFSENIGTPASPEFAPYVTGPFNLQPLPGCGGAQPAFGDMDGDGDYDMLTGVFYWAYCGDWDESYYLFYFENSGTASEPNFEPWLGWQAFAGDWDPFDLGLPWPPYVEGIVNVGDLDHDGDVDVLRTLSYWGAHTYSKNNGTPGAWDFNSGVLTDAFVNIYHTTNAIADLDMDGDLDVLTITGYYTDRHFYYYENTLCNLVVPTALTATAVTPTSAVLTWAPADTGYDYVLKIRDLTTGGIRKKYVSEPTYTFTSLTPGHDYAFTVWTECADFDTRRGPSEVYYFSTPLRAGMLDAQALIFPNPAHDEATIDIRVFEGEPVLISVYNTLGELMNSAWSAEGSSAYTLPLPYPPGTYYIQLIAGERTAVAAIAKN